MWHKDMQDRPFKMAALSDMTVTRRDLVAERDIVKVSIDLKPVPIPEPKHEMLPSAMGISYETFTQYGWTDDQLRAKGLMK